jgi:uncharacterized protein (TIGR02996 family)
MNDGEALLRAIIDEPDDDTPRLVYADFLDEQGDHDRAEFIRVECRLDHLVRARPDRYPLEFRARDLLCISDRLFKFEGHLDSQLEERDHELVALRGSAWADGLPDTVEYAGFRRGFVQEVGMSGRAFMTSAEELFARAPVRHVTFSRTPTARLPALTECPHLGRLRSASFAHKAIGPRGAEYLARCPHLARLEALDLTHCRIGDTGLAALASSPYLTRLSALDLWNNDLGAEGVVLLVSAPNLSRLAYLSVGRVSLNRFGLGGERALREAFGERVEFGLYGEP